MSREEDLDIDGDEDYDIGYGGEEESGLFWKMTIKPNEPTEIDQPAIPGYIVHVTNACFGVKVNQKSRSVVLVNASEDGSDPSDEAPICVLTQGNHENQQLDLLFNESATITVKGQKPSSVTLTGYLQPPVSEGDDIDPAMMEDMDEEQVMKMLKAQKRTQMALDDEEEDDEPQLIDEDDLSPPNKKQKTSESTSKSTKNGNNSPKKDKKRKETQKTPSDDKKEDKEEDKKQDKKKKKDKKMQTMKGGIKYRDMKVGSGDPLKHGDKVRVYYVGQLDDKKVFDKCISGQGFEFNYGKGDVIKGWDMGIKGMKVGGKRKLVIPPKLGYGQQGSPPQIGSNATLTFTIEVKGVN